MLSRPPASSLLSLEGQRDRESSSTRWPFVLPPAPSGHHDRGACLWLDRHDAVSRSRRSRKGFRLQPRASSSWCWSRSRTRHTEGAHCPRLSLNALCCRSACVGTAWLREQGRSQGALGLRERAAYRREAQKTLKSMAHDGIVRCAMCERARDRAR